uniref:Uncharacterized protein n=1 Tax=Glyptapanteles flavicoxis TaxID=463051 RepID=B7S8L2_9HYME|nr:hypothetical protein GFP_L2_0110 [Glyptapanteles flavicoxis]
MSNFVVVKIDEISSFGTNLYKCVPKQWVSDSHSNNVRVPYPSKYEIFNSFETIIYCELPMKKWKKYTGTIVHKTNTYYEGLRFILTQDSSYIPEELLYIQHLSNNTPRPRASRKLGPKIWRQFCNLFKS